MPSSLAGRRLFVACFAALCLSIGAPPLPAAQPAFDCSEADGSIEELICGDETLADLDREMSEVFERAIEKAPDEEIETLRGSQRGWIQRRNDCWRGDDPGACTRASYETRLSELQITYGMLVVPTPVTYDCQDGSWLTAVFYRDSKVPAAVLTRGDVQTTAFLAPSGSGARYEGRSLSLWEHHGEATVTWPASDAGEGGNVQCAARR